MPPRRNNFWAPLGRRLCAGVVLVTYLAVASGVPLPLGSDKDRSQPFPCQDHPCGCRSAEECWRHCCCFTPEEKLAWARSRGIEPPAYAERPGDRRAHGDEDAEPPPPSTRACCAGKSGGCCHTAERRSAPGRGWVAGLTHLRCRGLSTVWVTTGSVLPPLPPPAWRPWPPLDSTLSYADGLLATRSASPPDPPPRPLAA
jgi:hypothetical protein